MFHMIRFFTQEEAREKYRLPPSIEAKVFRTLRPQRGICGNLVYPENELDLAILKYLRPLGRVGRKITTKDYGELAKEMKKQGHSWSETAKAVNERYGTDYNTNSIRRCVRRISDRQLAADMEEKNWLRTC